MKIFLTGATGFLGKYVLDLLIKEKHTVHVLARSPESLSHIKKIKIVEGDVTSPETFSGKLKGCDAVIHLAGAVGYGQTFENCINVNINGTKYLSSEAVACGVRRFIHCSSVSVYGRISGVDLYEDAPYRKINDPYGDTKIDAEKALLEMKENLDITIFRPTVIYGKGDKMFLPQIAGKIRSGGFKIIGNGENRITLIHAHDAARAIIMSLNNTKTYGKIYNLSNTDNLTMNDLAELVAKTIGNEKPLKHLPFRIAIIAAGVMEFIFPIFGKTPPVTRFAVRILGMQYNYMTDAIRKDLKFKPEIDIRKGIVEALKSEEQH